ncbi:MAG: CpaF family protein [Bacteriovoracia bacterium]
MSVFDQSIATFLAPIKDFLADPTVSEVLINGPSEIWVERKGKLELMEGAKFHDETSLQAAVRNIAQFVKRKIDAENPTLDARLPDGSRIHAVLPPAARAGTTVAIRKFSKAAEITFDKFISFGTMSADGADFLKLCISLAKNIIVSGGTGSGKTTILNLLGGLMPKDERLMIVEDASELQITAEHVVCFETKAANHEGKGALTIRDLVRSAMRLRPDRIIVGEVRGPEALDLITVMNTGHGGSMGTTHSNSPMDCLVRLETLAMMGDTTIPLAALRRQIAGAVHIVIQAKRYHDGSRKLSHISEVLGVDEHGKYTTQDIFRFEQTGIAEDHKILGGMQPCGNIPTFFDEIAVNGFNFPIEKFALPGGRYNPFRGEIPLKGSPEAAGHALALSAAQNQGHAAKPAPAAVPPGLAHLTPAQMQALQAAAVKAGMTLAQYHQHLLAQQRAKAAAAKKAG